MSENSATTDVLASEHRDAGRPAVSPDAMLPCAECSRMNPPGRGACLYCGAPFAGAEGGGQLQKPEHRSLELWERGFNLIFRRSADPAMADPDRIGPLLPSGSSHFKSVVESGVRLPLARVETQDEADRLSCALKDFGVESMVVSDADLDLEKSPVRLSRIIVGPLGFVFVDFNTASPITVAFDELALIVSGSVFSNKVDSTARKNLRGKSTLLEQVEVNATEPILDLYTRHDPTGFRVRVLGFDFSCLADLKGMIAENNLNILAEFLTIRAPRAKLVDDYNEVRPLLDPVWQIHARKDASGMRHVGIGKRGFGTVESVTNLNQFEKYSRLQWHLL